MFSSIFNIDGMMAKVKEEMYRVAQTAYLSGFKDGFFLGGLVVFFGFFLYLRFRRSK